MVLGFFAKKIMKNFSGLLGLLVAKAVVGKIEDIDFIMSFLNDETVFATTRYVDFALSMVTSVEGLERIKYFLFTGNQIQRNYASLYLNRIGEYKPVAEAYKKGLIDEIQAFAR